MQSIHILPPSVADQIAAGEVVERPGSALKELLENSLDAKATQIDIHLEEGGLNLIQVIDNGIGISPEDLPLSLSRYATSKIHTAHDLESIHTYGFRGEALAALGAVSRLKIHSLERNLTEGKIISCEASSVSPLQTRPRRQGTTVTIENLFFNTPARKKFLKSSAAENNFCLQVIYRVAMANYSCAFTVHIDKIMSLQLPSRPNLLERLQDIYQQVFRLHLSKDDFISIEKKAPNIHLHGYLLSMNHCLNNTRGIFTFVNNRSVKDKLINQAILAGVKEVLFGHEYPQAIIFLDISPEYVDINVHPAKAEVRFREPSPFGFIRVAIRDALTKISSPVDAVIANMNSFSQNNTSIAVNTASTANATFSLPLDFHPTATTELPNHTIAFSPKPQIIPRYLGQIKNTYLLCEKDTGLLLIDQHAAHERVTYERLKKIRLQQNKELETSILLVPIVVETTNSLLSLIEPLFPELKKFGLQLERFGPNQIKISELPNLLLDKAGVPRVNISQWILSLANELAEENPKEEIFEIIQRTLLETLASESCHHSVRAGQRLSPLEVEALIQEMKETDYSAHCPHGRPTCVELDWNTIEKLFKRRL